MATQSAPVKKKPLIFKHRAVPSKPVSATTTTTTTTTAAVALDDSRDVSDDKTTPASVDLFRRSKKFFPKVFEEQSRRLAAEKLRHEPPTTTTAVSPPPLPEKQHNTKRRKVSYELPEDDDVAAVQSRPNTARSTTPPQSSPDKGKGKGKGKGIATRHSVNASVQFVEEIPDDDDDNDDDGVNNGDAEAAEREERLNLEQSKREEDIAFIKADEDADIGEIEEVKYIKTDGDHERDPKGDKKDDNDDIMEAVDPEFEEYILRARARDAEIRAEQARKALEAQRSTKSHAGPAAALSQSSATTDEATATLPAPVTSTKGQSYRIFITPHFPQSVPPLIANVRMDQEMHVVQNAFLRHAASKGVDLDEDTEATVLMTWKGTKIYSWTTGELLRIKPDSRGRFRDDAHDHHHHHHHSHSSHDQPAAFMSGGLHLEIWTQELYDAYQHEQEKRRLRNLGEVVDDEDLDDDDDHKGRGGDFDSSGKEASQSQHAGHNSQAGAEKPKGIRLVLVSRSHEKLNMTVYPDTNVETMVQVFRQQRQIPENQQITIHFDGDQLDEDSTVADADMDDLDEVEVHIH